ncbi:MAG: terminase TerL endonuclease subunit, partial [Bacteroidota bacterium]
VSEEFSHDGNPIMRWMISNTQLKFNETGMVKPIKTNDKDKIDGVIALIQALGESIDGENDPNNKPSKYETEDLMII